MTDMRMTSLLLLGACLGLLSACCGRCDADQRTKAELDAHQRAAQAADQGHKDPALGAGK